jgi:hypothetical protein
LATKAKRFGKNYALVEQIMITPSYGLTATERVLPRMALDFTTAVLDPRVTFTRSGNTATVINSSGLVALINADLPRFDFNPTTLVCKGLLIEEASTNLLSYSQDQSNAVWNVKTNVGVAASATIDPAGGTNAFTLTANANAVVFGRLLTGTIGLPYTYAIWIRRKTGTGGVRMYVGDNVGQTITSQVSSAWTRIPVSNTPTAITVRVYIQIDTSGDEIEVYGAQVEQKAFSTSYIPTTLLSVTRNADVATMTGTNFSDWYSAGAGGVVARVLPSTVSGTRPALQFDDATANEVIALRGNTTNPELVIVDGGSPQAQIDAGTIAANTAYNLGAAWNTDNCAAAVNGGAAVTDTSATIPTVTQARLGSDGTNYLNGNIQTLRYWPQRIINAEVQAFSK